MVCSQLSQPAILGMDAITKMKIALNPIQQKFFHVNTLENSRMGKLFKTTKFRAFEVLNVKISTLEKDGNLLVTPCQQLANILQIFIPDSIIKNRSGQGTIIVKNCSPNDLVIDKGENICQVEIVDNEVIEINRVQLEKQLLKDDDTPLPQPLRKNDKSSFLKRIKMNVPKDQERKYFELFLRNHDIFSKNKHDLGRANNFEHTIKLKDRDPIYRKQFRIPEAHQEALHKQIDEWLKIGIIEPCFSRYNSPIFIVPKKDGSFRFVLDYRALNEKSLEDRYTMKDVGECIGEIGRAGSTIFSTMDLTSGFWQLPLQQDSRSCTAFTCPGKGQFQYNVLSMGLKGGPGSFQRMMELAMIGLPNVIVYIDDLLLHTQDHDKHLRGLQKVFNRLRNINVKLNPEKCNFGSVNVSYLGFRLTPKGILPGSDKLRAVKEMDPPVSVTQVRQFLGLCNYFRTHVKNFSMIAAPLNRLTSKKTGWLGGALPADAKQAFQQLKTALVSQPVVAYPRNDRPFSLIVDAATGGAESKGGFGAILCQANDQQQLQVVAYASRSLKDHEKNYTPYLAEMNAAAWAIDHFDVYLRGRKFTLYTDHKPLETLKTIHQKTLNRLQERMNLYDFDLKYKKGTEMPADILSRMPVDVNMTEAIMDLSELTKQDRFCQDLLQYVGGKGTFSHRKMLILKKIAPFVTIDKGVIRLSHDNRQVIILPRALISGVLRQAHGTMLTGHGSIDKTLSRLRSQYYWPYMRDDVTDFIRECSRCQKNIKDGHTGGKLHPLPLCTATNQRIHCDLFGPLKTISSKAHVLCITDAHTKFVELVVVPTKEAEVVANAIFTSWICRYGIPDQILTDGGKEFCNKMFHSLCEFLDIEKKKTTPAHPQCNAQAEVVNKTIRKYLAAMTDNSLEWEHLIPALAFSYNTTHHRTIGRTPAELMLGYLPRSMIGKELPRYSDDPIMDTLRQFHIARSLANQEALIKTETYRQDHDKRKGNEEEYRVGQFVLLDKRLFLNENEKLADKWEGPYVILKTFPNGVIDILRKGRTIRVNRYRVKHFYALSDICSDKQLPETTFDVLEDLTKNDKESLAGEETTSTTAGEQGTLIFKETGTDGFPSSFQRTTYGRHPMVLRKRKNINSAIFSISQNKIRQVNQLLVSAFVRRVNFNANNVILDEFGLPLQVTTQKERLKIARRRRFLKSLPPAKRNALLTGDPAFAFDPIAYEYVWSRDRPPLDERIVPYFEHLPDVREVEKYEPKDEEDDKMGDFKPLSIKDEHRSLDTSLEDDVFEDSEMPPEEEQQRLFPDETSSLAQGGATPMIEDPTFYQTRSPSRPRTSDNVAYGQAPRYGDEYSNPWRNPPWNNPDGPATPTSARITRMEQSALRLSPDGPSSTPRGSLIRPSVLTPTIGWNNSPNSVVPSPSYQPTVQFGRQGGPRNSGTTGARVPTARRELWSPQGALMPAQSLPSISYQGVSNSQDDTQQRGLIPIRTWSTTSHPGDGDRSYDYSQQEPHIQNIGINSLTTQATPQQGPELKTSSTDCSTAQKATECPCPSGTPISSVTSSCPPTTRSMDTVSRKRRSTSLALFFSPVTQQLMVSPDQVLQHKKDEPTMITYWEDWHQYGLPVEWNRSPGTGEWELHQIGTPLLIGQSPPTPLGPDVLQDLYPNSSWADYSTPSGFEQRPRKQMSTFKKPTTSPWNASDVTPTPYIRSWQPRSLTNNTTTAEPLMPTWNSWPSDMPERPSTPWPITKNQISWWNNDDDATDGDQRVATGLRKNSITVGDHVLAFMGDNHRMERIRQQRRTQQHQRSLSTPL